MMDEKILLRKKLQKRLEKTLTEDDVLIHEDLEDGYSEEDEEMLDDEESDELFDDDDL